MLSNPQLWSSGDRHWEWFLIVNADTGRVSCSSNGDLSIGLQSKATAAAVVYGVEKELIGPVCLATVLDPKAEHDD